MLFFAVMKLKFFYVKRKITRKMPAKLYLENRESARILITSRLNYYNTFYGFSWNRVSIKDTRRRWGSCSRMGNLNFSYKLVLIPSELADYIIVHELCHLGQLNHSNDFWKLISRTIPDYKTKRKRLMDISRDLF